MADMHNSEKDVLALIERELENHPVSREEYLRFVHVQTGGTYDLAGASPPGRASSSRSDMEGEVRTSIETFRDTWQSLRQLQDDSGRGYLSGASEPDGMDVYLAHRQGLAGYQSIQQALEDGHFTRSDTSRHLLSDIDRHELPTMVEGIEIGSSRIPDADLASSYLRYWQNRFDRVAVPERDAVFADTVRDLSPGDESARTVELRAAYDLLVGSGAGGQPMGLPMVNAGESGGSTWIALAQNATMTEINQTTGYAVFSRADRFRPGYQGPADMIDASVRLGGTLLESGALTREALKPGMMIGEGRVFADSGGVDGIALVLQVPESADLRVARMRGEAIDAPGLDDYLADCRDGGISLCAVDPLARARDLIRDRQQELVSSLSQDPSGPPVQSTNVEVAQADPTHPDHALFLQARQAWSNLCGDLKQPADDREPQASIVAGNLAIAARHAGLSRVDHLMQNRDGTLVAIVQGELSAPDQQRVYVARDQALTKQVGATSESVDSPDEVAAREQRQETKPRMV